MARFTEYLIMRHGQSVADVEERFEGRADFCLTDKGLHQARPAADWIAANYPPQRILSSPLCRAKTTAQEVARRVNLVVEDDPELLERDNSVLAGRKKSELGKMGLPPLDKMLPHETVPGGESLIALRARAETFWSKLVSQPKVGQRILLVSHGQMIAMLFRCFLELPTSGSVRFSTGDTGIHCWRVDAKGCKVVFTNCRTHLEIAADSRGAE